MEGVCHQLQPNISSMTGTDSVGDSASVPESPSADDSGSANSSLSANATNIKRKVCQLHSY